MTKYKYAPELFPYIKIHVDQNRNTKGTFWLTGSQKYKLMDGVKESLAGRIAILDLMGLSYSEKIKQPFLTKPFLPSHDNSKKIKKLTIQQVYKLIREEQLPEPVVNKNIDREQYYALYIQSYIERDVKDFYNIERPIQFFNFVSIVAAQTGKLLNYTSLLLCRNRCQNSSSLDGHIRAFGTCVPFASIFSKHNKSYNKKTANPQLSDCRYFNQLNNLNEKVDMDLLFVYNLNAFL